MQRDSVQAGNAFITPVPVKADASGPYSTVEIPSNDTMRSRRPWSEREGILLQDRLEVPGNNTGNLATTRSYVGVDHLGKTTCGSQINLDEKGDHEKKSVVRSSVEQHGLAGPGDSQKIPSLEKKDMRRFRLTYNQTCFLMSEFTRQIYPDATHRERLSKMIPGLTPRQVQVWFQNRRAKLKRLMTNDRERMLKLQAIPDDFNTAATKMLGTPLESKPLTRTPFSGRQVYGPPSPDITAMTGLQTDCFSCPTEDEYLLSPLSTTSIGAYVPSVGQVWDDVLLHQISFSVDLPRLRRCPVCTEPSEPTISLPD